MRQLTDTTDIILGKNLKNCRILKGWSQNKLGQHFNISFQQIQKYEIGKNKIPAGMVAKAAKIFGKPISWFFNEAEDLQHFIFNEEKQALTIARYIMNLSEKQRDSIIKLLQSINENRKLP